MSASLAIVSLHARPLTKARATKLASAAAGEQTPSEPAPSAPTAPGTPRYYQYQPGAAVGEASGEPSVGYNPFSKRAMFVAGLQTLQVTFPENIAPPGSDPAACPADWKDVSFVTEKTRSLDPILFTDQVLGRTFVSQLNSVPVAAALVGANSLMAFSDTDGESNPANPNNSGWVPAQINAPDGSNDHQTVGTGSYPAALSALSNDINHGRAVYYCGQQGNVLVAASVAVCSRSDNGGLNFGKSIPVYPGAPVPGGCSQLVHGHIKAAPDGTLYLPNASCLGGQAVAVSTDAATTWTVHKIPDSTQMSPAIAPATFDLSDPTVAVASDGTVYFAYTGVEPGGNGTDNHVFVAVSHDRGTNWTDSVDIGASLGIKNAVFAVAVAGDPNRAAVGFIGTTESGNHQGATFNGTWYAYVAHTYDGGATWKVVNASGDPVQKNSCIWNSGGNNPCRNLLDFNDMTMDEKGRVIFGYADGCINECATGGGKTLASKATIAKQSGGKTLLGQFDAEFQEPVVPQRACLRGYRDDMASYLTWTPPDNGGSDLTAYYIYRSSTADPNFTFVGQAAGNTSGFNDRSVDPTVVTYNYKIIAVNSVGQSAFSNLVSLNVGPRIENNGSCVLPGVQAILDPAGDETSTLPAHDITSINVAEPPDVGDPTGKASNIVFTIKVASFRDSAGNFTIPPGWRWSIRFLVGGYGPPASLLVPGQQEDWAVSMVSSDNAAPTFTYGTTGVATVQNQQAPSRFFTTVGNLDATSSVQPDGTIKLVLPKEAIRSHAICNGTCQPLGPGVQLSLNLASTRATPPSAIPGAGGTNETIPDTTGAGGYTLRPTNLCLPNTAPIAVLTANVDHGDAPLTVTFDGSGSSDADAIDTIATYTFNFNDGSDDVVQSSPTIQHTFNKPGEYAVKLVVTDSRGKVSAGTAVFLLDVEAPVAGVASRKTHGGAGNFDLDLPAGGTSAIECRSGGANGDYTMVFKFGNTLASVGGASVTGGTGSVSGNSIGADPHEYVVNLTGVTNAQKLTVTLTNVTDSAGSTFNISRAMNVLVGDTTGDGVVNSADIAQTKSKSGQVVGVNSFRQDVTADGNLNSADIALVKSKSGTGLP